MKKLNLPPHQKYPNRFNTYLRYSGLALQLLLIIGLGGWGGYKLDTYMGMQFPLFMLVLGIGAFVGSLFHLYRSITRF